MKKKDVILLICVLVIAGLAALALFLLRSEAGGSVEVTVNGEVYGRYDLSVDQTIEIDTENGHNILVIEDGEVFMSEADCPDGYCMDQGRKSKSAQTIVCLPNKVIAEVISSGDDADADIDGVAN